MAAAVIEKYTSNTRFCIICNYVGKIIPALQVRRCPPLSNAECVCCLDIARTLWSSMPQLHAPLCAVSVHALPLRAARGGKGLRAANRDRVHRGVRFRTVEYSRASVPQSDGGAVRCGADRARKTGEESTGRGSGSQCVGCTG